MTAGMQQHGVAAAQPMTTGSPGARQPDELTTWLALGQGLYYALTGLWPLVHMETFQLVTGPKSEHWLVKTVGVLVTVIGAVLALAGRRRTVGPEVTLLATGSAAGLAAIDVIYVARRRIAPVYLLDAVAEVALIAGWLIARGRERGR